MTHYRDIHVTTLSSRPVSHPVPGSGAGGRAILSGTSTTHVARYRCDSVGKSLVELGTADTPTFRYGMPGGGLTRDFWLLRNAGLSGNQLNEIAAAGGVIPKSMHREYYPIPIPTTVALDTVPVAPAGSGVNRRMVVSVTGVDHMGMVRKQLWDSGEVTDLFSAPFLIFKTYYAGYMPWPIRQILEVKIESIQLRAGGGDNAWMGPSTGRIVVPAGIPGQSMQVTLPNLYFPLPVVTRRAQDVTSVRVHKAQTLFDFGLAEQEVKEYEDIHNEDEESGDMHIDLEKQWVCLHVDITSPSDATFWLTNPTGFNVFAREAVFTVEIVTKRGRAPRPQHFVQGL